MSVTATPSVAHGISVHAIEFSYTGGTCTFDTTANAGPSTGSTPINTPSLTPTNANSLIYMATLPDPSAGSGEISATNSPWTEGTRGTINSDTNSSVDGYILSASTAQAANWTVVSSAVTGWNAAAMSFFISGGVAATFPPSMMMMGIG
jgi:hypothetical protein